MMNMIQHAAQRAASATGLLRLSPAQSKAQPAQSFDLSLDEVAKRNLKSRQLELAEFYDSYENLVELVCNAAQYGPDARMEERFGDLRSAMQARYSSIHEGVVEFATPDKAQHWDRESGPVAPLAGLLKPPTLDALLRSDDGHMIERIELSRQLLVSYAEHLRQQAS